MRKHSVRKWLHAILDLLPVIILPIFAIYSHRHTIDSYEVTVPQNMVVDFNQVVNTSWLRDDFEQNGLTFDNEGYYYTVTGTSESFSYVNLFRSSQLQIFTVGHKYAIYGFNVPLFMNINGVGGTYENDVVLVADKTESYFEARLSVDTYDVVIVPQITDLTLMFGSGNEPTIEQFISWYPNDYYAFNTGTTELLKNAYTVTYDNSDIGSQMMYSLYKPINDYFNLNNVFNFGAIYDWFELNMFNGNAPLSIFIVWNIIVYEFIMDIIFLIYSVFMFVIDFATNTLDRFTGWAKRGD